MDVFRKPNEVDEDIVKNLGPLAALAGRWEGDQGVDMAGFEYKGGHYEDDYFRCDGCGSSGLRVPGDGSGGRRGNDGQRRSWLWYDGGLHGVVGFVRPYQGRCGGCRIMVFASDRQGR